MVREYFEKGCPCLIKGSMAKQGDKVDANTAAIFYEENCTCSRNYKHLEN